MTLPPAAAVITRLKFGGMRAAIIFAPNDLSVGSERRVGDSLNPRSRCHTSERKGNVPFSMHIEQHARIDPCRSGDSCPILKAKRRAIFIKCRSDIYQYKLYCYL